MKRHTYIILPLLAFSACFAHSQGTFNYDQQSSTTDTRTGGTSVSITETQPLGQSFTPTLGAVGFIRLFLDNGIPFDTAPATFYVNLRANSITGPVLGSSQPVVEQPGFTGTADFLFPTPVAVTPGSIYYLQPVVSVGGTSWYAAVIPDSYPGGAFFALGASQSYADLWFREGIIVPEPSALGLIIFGGALTPWRGKRKHQFRV